MEFHKDVVEVAVVRDQGLVGFFVGPIAHCSLHRGSFFSAFESEGCVVALKRVLVLDRVVAASAVPTPQMAVTLYSPERAGPAHAASSGNTHVQHKPAAVASAPLRPIVTNTKLLICGVIFEVEFLTIVPNFPCIGNSAQPRLAVHGPVARLSLFCL